jgi:hypothetical protein
VGYRLGAVVSAAQGNIESSALLGGVSLAYGTARRDGPWGGQLFLRADLVRVTFTGQAAANATGATGGALTGLAGCGASGWRSFGAWRAVGELSLAAVLRSVAALDAGQEVSALSGVVVGVALGVSAGL